MARGFNNTYTYANPVDVEEKVSSKSFVGKTFLYMFIGLAITFAVALGLGLFLSKVFTIDYASENVDFFAGAYAIYSILLTISAIGMLILTFVISFTVLRGRSKASTALFYIYSAMMGVLLSSFTMFVDFYVIGASLLLTCLAFGSMALIGYTSKKNLTTVAVAVRGLFIGVLLLSLFWVILSFTMPALYQPLYVFISFIYFIIIMLITIIDMNNVKRIAASGYENSNLALFCAMNLYNDFIYIFIRILSFIIRISARSRN